MNVVPLLAIGTGLVAGTLVAYAFGLNPRVVNGFYAFGAAFFLLSLSPHRTMGFALTAGDWGDQWRDWLGIGERPVATHEKVRWAAHKSIAIHSLFVLLGVLFASVSQDRPDQVFRSGMTGMGFGFWGGYLAVIGRRG